MKDNYPKVSLGRICRLFGITRQAYYQHYRTEENLSIEQELVITRIMQIRQHHRYMGGRKMYEMIAPFLMEHQIKMGRDALFDLLASHQLLVRRKRRKICTTQSFHWLRKYPNLIKDFTPATSNELWVSDITYWKISNRYLYISFITDAYSHKIVGYHVAESLEAVQTLKALQMALAALEGQPCHLIHHSDRGIQYCSAEYVKLLEDHKIQISMTQNGDPRENAIAERLNGIIKHEYLEDHEVDNLDEADKILSYSVELYNQQRPHMSIGNLVPDQVHQLNIKTEKLWKNNWKKSILVNSFQD